MGWRGPGFLPRLCYVLCSDPPARRSRPSPPPAARPQPCPPAVRLSLSGCDGDDFSQSRRRSRQDLSERRRPEGRFGWFWFQGVFHLGVAAGPWRRPAMRQPAPDLTLNGSFWRRVAASSGVLLARPSSAHRALWLSGLDRVSELRAAFSSGPAARSCLQEAGRFPHGGCLPLAALREGLFFPAVVFLGRLVPCRKGGGYAVASLPSQ